MPSPRVREAGERARWRLALALTGALAVGLVAVPLALLVRSAWLPLVEADQAATRTAERAVTASDPLLLAARVATLLGDPVLTWLAVLVAATLLAGRGHRRLALFLLVVRLGAQLLSTGLKLAVDRARPLFDLPVDAALGASFPSGHSVSAAAVWTAAAIVVLPLVARAVRALLLAGAVVVAVLVAATRVLLGVHFVSDVVGGLLLGIGWTAVCTAVLVRWRAEEGRPVDVVHEGLEPELGR